MKKFTTLTVAFGMAATLHGADFNAMEFRTTDGSTQTIGTAGLVITLDGGNIKVTNSAGDELIYDATNLQSMQFTSTSGIEAIDLKNVESVEVYDLGGVRIAEFKSSHEAYSSLDAGIYILKDKSGRTFKVSVKK